MKKAFPAIIAFLLAVSFGVAEGLWTDRWNQSEDLSRAAARCADVPRVIGEWEGTDRELDARQIEMAKIKGYIMRQYVNRQSGDSVRVLLLCGRPGPIAIHTPDICFQGGGYEMKGVQQQIKLDGAAMTGAPEFWAARFEKGHSGDMVRWSWTTNGSWIAATRPRIQFARAPALYKLYVIHPSTKPEQKPGDDADLDSFLRTFLPVVQNTLFPAPKD